MLQLRKPTDAICPHDIVVLCGHVVSRIALIKSHIEIARCRDCLSLANCREHEGIWSLYCRSLFFVSKLPLNMDRFGRTIAVQEMPSRTFKSKSFHAESILYANLSGSGKSKMTDDNYKIIMLIKNAFPSQVTFCQKLFDLYRLVPYARSLWVRVSDTSFMIRRTVNL